MDLTLEGVYENSFEMLFSHDSLILLWWPCVLDMMLKVQLLTGINLSFFSFLFSFWFLIFLIFFLRIGHNQCDTEGWYNHICAHLWTGWQDKFWLCCLVSRHHPRSKPVYMFCIHLLLFSYVGMLFYTGRVSKKKRNIKKWGAQFMWEIWTVQWSLVWLSVWPARHTKNRIVTNFFINK